MFLKKILVYQLQENIAFIESHKDDFLKLVKVLGPTLIENGRFLAVAEFYSKIP